MSMRGSLLVPPRRRHRRQRLAAVRAARPVDESPARLALLRERRPQRVRVREVLRVLVRAGRRERGRGRARARAAGGARDAVLAAQGLGLRDGVVAGRVAARALRGRGGVDAGEAAGDAGGGGGERGSGGAAGAGRGGGAVVAAG